MKEDARLSRRGRKEAEKEHGLCEGNESLHPAREHRAHDEPQGNVNGIGSGVVYESEIDCEIVNAVDLYA